MAKTLHNTDFESETIDTFPTGAGDTGGGSWDEYPVAEGTILIKDDPGAAHGKTLSVDSGSVTTGSRLYATYTFDELITNGAYTITWKMMRPNIGPAEDVGIILSSGSRSRAQILIKIKNSGVFQFVGFTGALDMYSEANYPTTTTNATANTWYSCICVADNSTGLCTITIDGVPQGWDFSGTWKSSFPLGQVSTPILYGYVNKISYYTTNTASPQLGYFDDCSVVWDSTDSVQDTPPTKITIVSPFSLDSATVTSYKDTSTPNVAGLGSLEGSNTLYPSVGRKWYSEDTDNTYHKVSFDLGEDNEETLRYFAIFNHNLDEIANPDVTGSFAGLRIIGGNSISSGIINSPELNLDIFDQKNLDPIIAWLPDHTACRYYNLEVLFITGPINSINNIQIGRIVGATEDEIWTPDDEFYYQYKWEDVFPADMVTMESYSRQARYHSLFKQLSLSWPWLNKSDQEDLRTLFADSGTHKQYVVMLDATNRPQEYTLLGYMNRSSINMSRYCSEGSNINTSFRETVE